MKKRVYPEAVIFLAINLIAPAAYGFILTTAPRVIAFYASILVFALLQALNFQRVRNGNNLMRYYLPIIALNTITLIAIGNIAFLSSLPVIWGMLTSLL